MQFFISVSVTLVHAASNLKSLNHEIKYTNKNGPTKYSREKNSDPRNTHDKTFWTHEYPPKNFGPAKSQEKNFRPTKYPREKFWTHEIPTKSRWHDGTKPTRPTIARDPRNLAHSIFCLFSDEKRAFSFFLWGFPCKLNTFWLGTYHTKFRFSIIR